MPTHRVLGPYRDKQGWRCILVDRGGKRSTKRWPEARDEQDARDLMDAYLAEQGIRTELHTVSTAVDAYLDSLRAQGQAAVTVTWHRAAYAPITEKHGALDLDDLRITHVEAFIAGHAESAIATQETYWLALGRMMRWWVARRFLARDLCADVLKRRQDRREPLVWTTKAGRRLKGRGKPQLRNLDEARAYLAAALKQPTAERRCAASLPLLVNLSSGEVRHLRVCDVDFAAKLLRVRSDAAWHG